MDLATRPTGTPPPPLARPRWTGAAVAYLRHHHIVVLITLGVLVSALALDVVVVLHPGPLPGDVGSTLALQHLLLPHRTISWLINQTSELTWPVPALLTTFAVVGLLLLLRRWLDTFILIAFPALDSGATYLTTLLVQRPRPLGHGIVIQLFVTGYWSYPSGHIAHALTFFGLLVFFTYRLRRPTHRAGLWVWRSRWWVWPLRLFLVAIIVLMGPSRLLEGEHWLSDVVAGYLYGAFWLILGIAAYGLMARHWPWLLAKRWPWPLTRGERSHGTA